jgi:hypothetical protein
MPAHQHRQVDYGLKIDAEIRRMVLRKLGHDLKQFYEAETQIPPWLQALLQKLDEQQK